MAALAPEVISKSGCKRWFLLEVINSADSLFQLLRQVLQLLIG